MDSNLPETGDSLARNPRILLADDSSIERSAMALYLRSLGYDVHEADGGKSAIDYLKSNEIDALLLDLQMPSVDGFDVLSYLQEHRGGLPIILLSGMPVDQIQREIHGLPKQELPPLMLKPVDLDQLVQLLELELAGALPTRAENTE